MNKLGVSSEHLKERTGMSDLSLMLNRIDSQYPKDKYSLLSEA